MLGRGAVADPFLARRIRAGRRGAGDRDAEWAELLPLIGEFWQRVLAKVEARHAPGRLKQWLNLLRRNFPQGEILYAAVRARSDVNVGKPGAGRPRHTGAQGRRVKLPDVRQFKHSRERPAGCS
jgi:tRNA-dihydrouridine synthase